MREQDRFRHMSSEILIAERVVTKLNVAIFANIGPNCNYDDKKWEENLDVKIIYKYILYV